MYEATATGVCNIITEMNSIGGGSFRALAASLLIGIALSALGDAAATCPRGWCGMVGVALVGFNHSVCRTDTQGLCHGACTAEPRCRSVNYELKTGMCHLVYNASHHSDPDRLALRRGWFYSYIDVEPRDEFVTAQNQEPPCLENYPNDVPDIIRTIETFPSNDLSLARRACSQYAMQLCTLAQLKAAYRAGRADDSWALIDVKGRDAKLTPCGSYYGAPGECYYIVEGRPDESLIPTTPRPAVTNKAYCCSTNHTCSDSHALQWQLVFKGLGGQQKSNRSLYEIWTDRQWDSTLVNEGNYRDQTIYDAWNHTSSQLKLVKLSLFNTDEAQPAAQLIFSGVHSNITNWFSIDRLMGSPWLDLKTDTVGFMAMEGSQSWPGRHFLINGATVECVGDMGWLFIVGSKSTCSWVDPFTIMYSTTKYAATWSGISGGGVGVADYMTIHVLWSKQSGQ
ncbi:uncharacterized protein LOC119727533 [Patiria miniata]|uniref:Apple domain-containing protein n=1 Tax=Patiria miniata TaxID=46514 RepID=A0A913ZWC2_PATMI|nr:uncharacterized protein LOC119727533 [Patiria miniata]